MEIVFQNETPLKATLKLSAPKLCFKTLWTI